MEIDYSESRIKFEKELNKLDEFVIDFTKVLDRAETKYVIISGYVAILFGRSRSSEDIDTFIEIMDFDQFQALWDKLMQEFDCIITDDPKDAFEYLTTDHAIRFAKKGEFIPNMEVKFPKQQLDLISMQNRKEVLLNKDNSIFISPLELQIAFKLKLGSEKDIEDARFLYKIFEEYIDIRLLLEFNRKFNVVDLFNRYIK